MNATAPIDEVVITTPEFCRGQAEARKVAQALCAPNWDVIPDGEFGAGFRHEWREYIAPMLAIDPEWSPAR